MIQEETEGDANDEIQQRFLHLIICCKDKGKKLAKKTNNCSFLSLLHKPRFMMKKYLCLALFSLFIMVSLYSKAQIIKPEPGTMVYDTNAKQLAVFNGTVWTKFRENITFPKCVNLDILIKEK